MLARSFVTGTLLAALLPGTAASQIVVVVPAKSKIDSLSSKDLQKIFKGEPAGPKQLTPLQIVEFAPAGDDFYTQLYGANSYAIAKHWLRLIFSGARVLPPKSFSDAAKFLGYLAAHDNAIGFLPLELLQQAKDNSIRAVLIDGRDYHHPQYLLRKKAAK
ncbi:MAG: hypothetical protein ONB43_00445 [candidate division KSB1 bacterium]|nr:hypothetical protein [candidate division KSB1 bacterium]